MQKTDRVAEFQLMNEKLVAANNELNAKFQELNRHNRDLNILLELTGAGAIFLDKHLCISHFTPRATDLFVLTDADIGQPLAHIAHYIHHIELNKLAARVRQTLTNIEETVQATAKEHWFLLRLFPHRGQTGEFNGLIITFVDMNDLKHAESEERQLHQQQVLAQLGRRALENTNLDDLFSVVTQQVAETLDMEFCKLLELRPDGQSLLLRAGVGWDPGLVGQALVPTDVGSHAGYTLRTRGPVIMRNQDTETRFHGSALLIDHGVHSGISVTIYGPNGPYGVLGVHSRKTRNFAPSDVDFLQTVAHTLAAAIVRQQAANSLRESAARLRLGTTVAGLAIADVDYLTNTIALEPETATLFGLAADTGIVPRATIHALFHPEDRDTLHTAIANALDPAGNRWFAMEHRIIRPSGETRWLSVRKQVFFAEGDDGAPYPLRALMVARDITDRKWAEEKLRQSEERYRYLFEALDEGFCVIDLIFDHAGTPLDFRFIETNPAFDRLTGLKEAVGKTMRELVPDLEPFWFEIHGQVALTGEPQRFEEESKVMNRWFDVYSFRIGDAESRRVALLFNNITRRKRAEGRLRFLAQASNALAHSLDYHETLQNLAQSAISQIADWCSVDLCTVDGGIENVIIAHADPEKMRWAEELRQRHPVDPQAAVGLAAVIRSGESAHYPSITDELLQSVAKDEAELRLLRSVGYRSVMIVPLAVQERILGAITFVTTGTDRSFSTADLEMAEELARRAAIAIENAQLYRDIQQHEAELRQNEERLRLATEAGRIGIVDYDWDSSLTNFSDIYCEITGFSPTERPTLRSWLARIHPDDRPLVEEKMQRARDYGESSHYEYRIYHTNGSLHWVDVSTLVTSDQAGRGIRITGAVRDITTRKTAEVALRQSEERFRSAFDQAAVGMAHLDMQGHYLRVNDRLCDILGYSRAELLQKTFMDITHPDDLESDLTQMARQVEGGLDIHRMEKRYLRKDGSYVWANMTASVIYDEAGVSQYGSVVVEDISLRKAANAALQELNETLERRVMARTAELEQSNRDLDQFAYVASHDLKAPLRAIAHLATWIVEDTGDTLPTTSQQHLQTLRGRVRRMETLLEDLLTYSRAGRIRGDASSIPLGKLVDNVIELMRPSSGFELTRAPEMPTITTHHAPLELVLRNLIGNAIKHHHRALGHIHVAAVMHGEFVEITVQDDGPGIADDFHQRIFDMFQTLQPRDEREGSGIGLAIVKKTVESLGGQVWLESRPDQGTTFHFTWPLTQ